MRPTAMRPARCPACGVVIARIDPRWTWNRESKVMADARLAHRDVCVREAEAS